MPEAPRAQQLEERLHIEVLEPNPLRMRHDAHSFECAAKHYVTLCNLRAHYKVRERHFFGN